MKALLVAASLFLSASVASANITITGTGKVTYTPDIGYVTVCVSSDGATAAEAWEKNRAIVEKIFAFLKSKGIEPVTVPAGKHARNRSNGETLSRNSPATR